INHSKYSILFFTSHHHRLFLDGIAGHRGPHLSEKHTYRSISRRDQYPSPDHHAMAGKERRRDREVRYASDHEGDEHDPEEVGSTLDFTFWLVGDHCNFRRRSG